jgi:hypothetical protein
MGSQGNKFLPTWLVNQSRLLRYALGHTGHSSVWLGRMKEQIAKVINTRESVINDKLINKP